LCGEILLEYTIQRFDVLKTSSRDNLQDDGPEDGGGEDKIANDKSKGKKFIT
jgi:hypothetical protein